MAGAADGSRGVSASAPPAAATNSRNLRRDEDVVRIDAFTLHLVGLVTVPTSANTATLPGTPPAIKESVSPADVLVIDTSPTSAGTSPSCWDGRATASPQRSTGRRSWGRG